VVKEVVTGMEKSAPHTYLPGTGVKYYELAGDAKPVTAQEKYLALAYGSACALTVTRRSDSRYRRAGRCALLWQRYPPGLNDAAETLVNSARWWLQAGQTTTLGDGTAGE
jgi:hypothetical protein